MVDRATIQPVVATPADLLALHAHNPGRYPHLLASGGGGRYDILLAWPRPAHVLPANAGAADYRQFLAAISSAIVDDGACDLPFVYGQFLYLGYELAALLEPRLHLPPPSGPLAYAERCEGAVIHDRMTGRSYITAIDGDLATATAHDLTMPRPVPPADVLHGLQEEDPQLYIERIARVKAYIRAGDIFQANLSRRYSVHVPAAMAPASLMAALMAANPAPHAALTTLGGTHILCASPERLVEVRGRQIRTVPIAGTAARGRDADADRQRGRRLSRHPKERAEHIMLVDLERNDLGRICQGGTVCVPRLMARESYATVHHLVSEVRGVLRDDITIGDIIAALFPGGTITGCPKLRAIEILAELEAAPRGPYTGSLGYINYNGDLDLNILIRTAVLEGETLWWRVGGGIVADSDPRRELAETQAKAAGLRRAFRI